MAYSLSENLATYSLSVLIPAFGTEMAPQAAICDDVIESVSCVSRPITSLSSLLCFEICGRLFLAFLCIKGCRRGKQKGGREASDCEEGTAVENVVQIQPDTEFPVVQGSGHSTHITNLVDEEQVPFLCGNEATRDSGFHMASFVEEIDQTTNEINTVSGNETLSNDIVELDKVNLGSNLNDGVPAFAPAINDLNLEFIDEDGSPNPGGKMLSDNDSFENLQNRICEDECNMEDNTEEAATSLDLSKDFDDVKCNSGNITITSGSISSRSNSVNETLEVPIKSMESSGLNQTQAFDTNSESPSTHLKDCSIGHFFHSQERLSDSGESTNKHEDSDQENTQPIREGNVDNFEEEGTTELKELEDPKPLCTLKTVVKEGSTDPEPKQEDSIGCQEGEQSNSSVENRPQTSAEEGTTKKRHVSDDGRRTPDFDGLGTVSFRDQATMRFPSETHRGTVERVAAQTQPSFEMREAINCDTDEAVRAPNEEDHPVLLSFNKRKKLDKIFRQLMRSMGKNIPEYIQSMYQSDKWWRVYINIDHGCVEETWNFLKQKCPKHATKDLIQLIEQTSRPEFLAGKNIEGGMKLYALTPDIDLHRVLRDRQYFANVKGKLPFATLGALLCEKDTSFLRFYGLTVMHLVSGKDAQGEVNVNTVVTIPDGTSEKVIHFGSTAHGIYGYKEIHGTDCKVDILLIPITEQVANHPALKKALEMVELTAEGEEVSRHELQVDVFEGPSDELRKCLVHKNGAITGITHGEVKLVDCVIIEGGRPQTGVFAIATQHPDIRPFVIPGDSGAVILMHLRDSKYLALGLVHRIMDHLKIPETEREEGGPTDLYNVVFCVNLHNCLVAMEQMLNIKLKFYKNPLRVHARGDTRMELSEAHPVK